MRRREFLGLSAGALAGCAAPGLRGHAAAKDLIWANLLHFGVNIQCDLPVTAWGKYKGEDLKLMTAADHVRFDESVWRKITGKMVEVGMNMIVIDLEEALYYPSHPELAVRGTWDVERFRKELARLRSIGLEPIPKLNFSTAHDIWLKDYHRMVSTPKYYQVVADVIRDVVETFDRPRFFHIGFDEESFGHQRKHSIAIVRQGDLWWHDLLFITGTIEKTGVRPWMWSDYIWRHKDEFLRRMPRSILQSNWYYGRSFDRVAPDGKPRPYVEAYRWLDEGGFDQIPTGSNWSCTENIAGTVAFAREHVAPSHLKGFLSAPWVKTLPQFQTTHDEQVDEMAAEIKKW